MSKKKGLASANNIIDGIKLTDIEQTRDINQLATKIAKLSHTNVNELRKNNSLRLGWLEFSIISKCRGCSSTQREDLDSFSVFIRNCIPEITLFNDNKLWPKFIDEQIIAPPRCKLHTRILLMLTGKAPLRAVIISLYQSKEDRKYQLCFTDFRDLVLSGS